MIRGYAAVGLYSPKTSHNIGSVLRACGCFDASLVVVEGKRYSKAPTDTPRAHRHLPLMHGALLDMIPFDCVPVAVELCDRARSIHSYEHPERAFYMFGPEDGSLPEPIVLSARDVIYIPSRHCLNLAMAVNVILYDRSKKRARNERVMIRREVSYGTEVSAADVKPLHISSSGPWRRG